jgi:sugar-specific transcriptional regulator TrmB
MLKELQDLGLSEKEAQVYLAALEIGRATADQLSKQSKLVRPTTYVQIKSLMEMGLMSTYEEGKKTFFAPETPAALQRLLQRKKEELSSNENLLAQIIPDLMRQYEGAGQRPIVRFFPGKEGITTMRNLALATKTKKFSGMYSYEAFSDLFSIEERRNYTKERIAQNIETRVIVSTSEKEMTNSANVDFIKVSALDLPLSIDLLIWDNKINISLYKGNPFGVLIESDETAKSFLSIYNFLWESLKEKYKTN